MGMYINESTIEDTVCIDENYTGVMGCMQLISDCIHNEQVMFESLFNDDYKEALNESEDDDDEDEEYEEDDDEDDEYGRESRIKRTIYKLCNFIIRILENLRGKIISIIDAFSSKFDDKKSKELRELSAKLPSDLSASDEKVRHLVDKYINTKEYYLWMENRDIDKSAILKILDLSQYEEVIKDNKNDAALISLHIKRKLNFAIRGIYEDEEIYGKLKESVTGKKLIENLKNNPSYIIDSTLKNLRDLKHTGTGFLDAQKKDIKRNLIDTKKTKNEEDIKDAKNMLFVAKSIQTTLPTVISEWIYASGKTYKAYLYCLKYLTSDTKEETVNDSYLMELEESINYDVDYEFGTL